MAQPIARHERPRGEHVQDAVDEIPVDPAHEAGQGEHEAAIDEGEEIVEPESPESRRPDGGERVGKRVGAEEASLIDEIGQRDARESHDHRGVFIPPGVAHGFAALTDMTITYLVDGYYNAADELGVLWNDPAVTADWGVTDPILSKRDQTNPTRDGLDPARRPHYGLRV